MDMRAADMPAGTVVTDGNEAWIKRAGRHDVQWDGTDSFGVSNSGIDSRLAGGANVCPPRAGALYAQAAEQAGVEEMQDLVDDADDAADEGSNDREIGDLREALNYALSRWPEVTTRY